MNISQSIARCSGTKLVMRDKRGREVGRAFLYIMHNDLHNHPFGLMEDVYIEKEARGSGLGTDLVRRVVEVAKSAGCYKLIATSRHSRIRVHKLYVSLGFSDHGKEFRIDL